MHTYSRIAGRSERPATRRGLAPLELVLTLPLMLFVMALIINFGVVACWKVRAGTVARQAVWRQRFDRNGQSDPLPAGWPSVLPPSATVPAANPPTSVGSPASLFQDPFPPQQYPVARGPTLSTPNGGGATVRVNQDLFDVTQGVQIGNGSVSVPMPLLPKLPKVTYNVQHPLLSGRWQFGEMGLPANESLRIPRLYPDLDSRFPFFNNVVQPARDLYVQAVDLIRNNGQLHGDLLPLIGEGQPDPITGYPGGEFYLWYSQFNPGYIPPSFYPWEPRPRRVCPDGAQACTLDPNFDVGPHVQAIGRVPQRMKDAYIKLYTDQITYWKNQTPPNNAQIQALQKIIDTQLQPFVTQ